MYSKQQSSKLGSYSRNRFVMCLSGYVRHPHPPYTHTRALACGRTSPRKRRLLGLQGVRDRARKCCSRIDIWLRPHPLAFIVDGGARARHLSTARNVGHDRPYGFSGDHPLDFSGEAWPRRRSEGLGGVGGREKLPERSPA